MPTSRTIRSDRGRIAGIDGIRGLAALFVVLHHCYLVSFPGYPENTGPHWTAWLLYGHLSVTVFIVVSGFSLAVAPSRSGWRLRGLSRFAHRRAWRILPPYWAALLFSLVVAWTLAPQPGSGSPTARTVVVYGLLLQDAVSAPNPNGAMWSIAVEAQLYLVFPIMLVLRRRAGAAALLGTVTAVVVTIGALAPGVRMAHLVMRLTPQFAVLFALGLVAAGVLGARRVPPPWLAALAAAPVLIGIVIYGSAWRDANQFWVDLALGPAVALLIAAVAGGRPAGLIRVLDAGPIRRLGLFSYSLYLIHAPIVVAVHARLVSPHTPAGLPTFGLTLALAVPVALGTAWLFARVFELPFQRHRSLAELRAAARGDPSQLPAPA